MSLLTLALVIVFVCGAAAGVYAWLAPRQRAAVPSVERAPLRVETDWSNEVAQEFAGLSEPARCEMIFAAAALDDDRSQRLLEHALDDPSEAVATAAAHALATRGSASVVQTYLGAHAGERADRIARTLSLLGTEAGPGAL